MARRLREAREVSGLGGGGKLQSVNRSFTSRQMLRRAFGKTSLQVSAIGLGCWIFGVDRWGHYGPDDAVRLMQLALEQGISFFDCGDAYGNGRAETILGAFARSVRRDQIQIGGKFGYDFYSDPGRPENQRPRQQDFSAKFMRMALEQSLRRLGVDSIDLYMAHDLKLPQFNDELFAELAKAQDQGKIKLWGVSLGPGIGWREEGMAALLDKGAKAVQSAFNLFQQDPGREFCQTARACGAGVLARVHDNGGVLKDKHGPDRDKSPGQTWKIYALKKLELIRHYAADHGMTVHQLACKWLLMDDAVTSITATLLDEAEIKEACQAVDKPPLSRQEMLEIAADYARDWDLGEAAHPCNVKSSTDPSGTVRSSYVPPPVLIA